MSSIRTVNWVSLVWVFSLASCAPDTGPEPGMDFDAEDTEWLVNHGDDAASRYAPLGQINRDNVAELEVAWYWESIDEELKERNEEAGRMGGSFWYEPTPLLVDGTLYTITGMGQIAAIHPGTGETLWSYDPKTWESGRPVNLGFIVRGISYWTDGERKRILIGSNDAFLISLDTETGEPDPVFGEAGRVDLTRDFDVMVEDRRAFLRGYGVNSPVTIIRDVAVVGASIRDTPTNRNVTPGWVRGYDVRTGELLWTFHTIPLPGEFGNDTWEDDSWRTAGATGVWPPMSGDEELGYVYLPVGTPSHNWYGGHRLGENLYANSLVCVDVETGEIVWYFQFVHHSVWDYDPPAAPNLIDITVDGREIKAVAQVTKQGFLFVFDRVTGEPVWPIGEQPVPPSDIEGERIHPTQPIPTKPAPFEPNGAFEENLIDFTPELRAQALEIFQRYRSGPVYTPPSAQGTIVNPGWAGGGNWNGAAFDPETQYLYIPSYSDYTVVELAPPENPRSDFDYIWGGAQSPTVDGIPIFKPPWGRVTAIDMSTGEHVWQVANGRGPRDHPALADLDLGNLGVDGESFPLLTSTLLFTTVDRQGSQPAMLNAYDKSTGEMLLEYELPGGVHANPMTYMYEGKQYLVVSVNAGQDGDGVVALVLE